MARVNLEQAEDVSAIDVEQLKTLTASMTPHAEPVDSASFIRGMRDTEFRILLAEHQMRVAIEIQYTYP